MFINYKLADGNKALVEVTEEVAEFILEDDRLTANADRREERYNCPYHIEAMDYEGDSLADHLTPEQLYIRKETQLEHSEAVGIYDLLHLPQKERAMLLTSDTQFGS